MRLLGDNMLMKPWEQCNFMRYFINKIIMLTVAHWGKIMLPQTICVCHWNKRLKQQMNFVAAMKQETSKNQHFIMQIYSRERIIWWM